MNFPPILLASGSPRRKFLLKDAGFDVRFSNPNVDESYPPELTASEIPLYLAKKKIMQ